MLVLIERFAGALGVRGLELDMEEQSLDRILSASFLPFVLISSLLAATILSFVFDNRPLIESGPRGFGDGDPVVWSRLWWITQTSHDFLLYGSLALLVVHGIARWSRPEAGWMFVIGSLLLLIAVVCGAVTIGLHMLFNYVDAQDLRANLWSRWAGSLALLSAGYFFVAYRGLTRPALPQPRHRREDAQPDDEEE